MFGDEGGVFWAKGNWNRSWLEQGRVMAEKGAGGCRWGGVGTAQAWMLQ